MLAVVGALFANALIAVLKLAAAFVTGSSGMMAEALHSFADTTNQVFLLLGLRFFRRPASEKHPFGYGKERFFWSFIAAIFIFGVGSTYAVYEGVVKLKHPHAPANLFWAYLVLALSFMLESASISLAIYQELKEARAEGFSFFQYLRESKDPTAKTVLFEDSAALLGVVLAIVAFALARTSRALLLGEAASAKTVQRIREAIESHPNVVKVIEILTMHLAPKQILINAHVNLRDDLVTSEIERTIEEIEQIIRKAEPKVEMIFLETARASHSPHQELVPEHVG